MTRALITGCSTGPPTAIPALFTSTSISPAAATAAVMLTSAVTSSARRCATSRSSNTSGRRAVGPLNGFYAASKWALEALSEAMYLELAHWGIKVIAIEPGYIATPMLEKDEGYGADVPPYDELGRIWEAASTKLSGGDPPGPELVAAAIADALEEEEPVLRHPVGADAEMVVAARESMSYEQFVASMRDLLGLDW